MLPLLIHVQLLCLLDPFHALGDLHSHKYNFFLDVLVLLISLVKQPFISSNSGFVASNFRACFLQSQCINRVAKRTQRHRVLLSLYVFFELLYLYVQLCHNRTSSSFEYAIESILNLYNSTLPLRPQCMQSLKLCFDCFCRHVLVFNVWYRRHRVLACVMDNACVYVNKIVLVLVCLIHLFCCVDFPMDRTFFGSDLHLIGFTASIQLPNRSHTHTLTHFQFHFHIHIHMSSTPAAASAASSSSSSSRVVGGRTASTSHSAESESDDNESGGDDDDDDSNEDSDDDEDCGLGRTITEADKTTMIKEASDQKRRDDIRVHNMMLDNMVKSILPQVTDERMQLCADRQLDDINTPVNERKFDVKSPVKNGEWFIVNGICHIVISQTRIAHTVTDLRPSVIAGSVAWKAFLPGMRNCIHTEACPSMGGKPKLDTQGRIERWCGPESRHSWVHGGKEDSNKFFRLTLDANNTMIEAYKPESKKELYDASVQCIKRQSNVVDHVIGEEEEFVRVGAADKSRGVFNFAVPYSLYREWIKNGGPSKPKAGTKRSAATSEKASASSSSSSSAVNKQQGVQHVLFDLATYDSVMSDMWRTDLDRAVQKCRRVSTAPGVSRLQEFKDMCDRMQQGIHRAAASNSPKYELTKYIKEFASGETMTADSVAILVREQLVRQWAFSSAAGRAMINDTAEKLKRQADGPPDMTRHCKDDFGSD